MWKIFIIKKSFHNKHDRREKSTWDELKYTSDLHWAYEPKIFYGLTNNNIDSDHDFILKQWSLTRVSWKNIEYSSLQKKTPGWIRGNDSLN